MSDLEQQINQRNQEILQRILTRLDQRALTGHPVNLNATEVKHLWQHMTQQAAYQTYLEGINQEYQNTNRTLVEMVNKKDETRRSWFRLGRSGVHRQTAGQ